jgi:hypothetical protein
VRTVTVAVSTIADGSMYLRSEPGNSEIIENRKRWFAAHSIEAADATRLFVTFDDTEDFCRYVEVDASNKGQGMADDNVVHADALITATPGHALFLGVADCIATTLFDEEHSVLMLTHLGRHSLEQDGGLRSVQYLTKHYGSDPAALKVWTTPSVNKEVYPIFKLNGMGMKEAFFEQMSRAGIVAKNIIDISADTAVDPDYYSHSEFLKGNKPEGSHAMIAVMSA